MVAKFVKMIDIDFDKWFDVNYKTLNASEWLKAKSLARTAWETAGSIQYSRGYEDGLNRVHEE